MTTLGWAAYLACSWTWCIGMFLPVLLVRDFGIWGFVVFAVPNVIGAGGMGWVLKNPDSAEKLTRGHVQAIRMFSFVTVQFQYFFLCWLMFSNKTSTMAIAAVALVVAVFLGVSTLSAGLRRRVPGSILMWAVSVTLLVASGVAGGLSISPRPGASGSNDVLWLAPVCAFGFLLCPYLDATFLKARLSQSLRQSKQSFSVGFGVLFATMITFTLLYAGLFATTHNPVQFEVPVSIAAVLVFLHIGWQIIFTTDVHGQACAELCGQFKWLGSHKDHPFISFVPAIFVGSFANAFEYHGLNGGEIVYRAFMSFYGLSFPAYVWLCMIALRGEQGTQKPTGMKLTVLAVAIALATPCFWMGFIERQTWWLGPGLGIVLLARPVLAVLSRRRSLRTMA